jgi:hypothetical protein
MRTGWWEHLVHIPGIPARERTTARGWSKRGTEREDGKHTCGSLPHVWQTAKNRPRVPPPVQ